MRDRRAARFDGAVGGGQPMRCGKPHGSDRVPLGGLQLRSCEGPQLLRVRAFRKQLPG